jgi:hypothetical protein
MDLSSSDETGAKMTWGVRQKAASMLGQGLEDVLVDLRLDVRLSR